VAIANLVHTLSWRQRKARLIAAAEDGVLEQVLLRLLPLIGADRVLEPYIDP
jgi:mRNA interferase MazF